MSDLQSKFEQWAADYSLRFDLAAFKAGAQSQASIVEDANANAPWLSLAHSICTDSGIEHGHIKKRLQALQDKLRAIAQLEREPVLKDIEQEHIKELQKEIECLKFDLRGYMNAANSEAQFADELNAEIVRLNNALKWEQSRTEHIGTHGPNCWAWGSSHYACALLEIKRLNDEEGKK